MAFEIEMQRIFRRVRPGILGVNSNPTRNLALVVDDLKTNGKWLDQFQASALEFLCRQDFVPSLTESGLMIESGFFSEIFRKIEYKFLPKAMDDRDFLAFLGRLFDAVGGSDWIERVKEDTLSDFISLLVPNGQKLLEEVGPQLFQAMEILSLRLAYFGVENDVYTRLKERPDLQHAFLNVQHDLQKMLDGKGYDKIPSVQTNLNLCQESVRYIRSKRGKEGISLGLTFRLMRIQELSTRMLQILAVMEAIVDDWNPKPLAHLLKSIIVNETKRFELHSFIGRHLELLAYQITEHTGKAGEHYITSSRREWQSMFWSAAIGGAVVALLTISKSMLSLLPLAPALQALTYGSLYAAGFVAILSVGGTLASKQPAMTASRIAAALDEATSSEQAMLNLCEMIVRLIRSQLIALLGNYLVAFPVAVAICAPFVTFHLPLIPRVKAEHLFHDLHPWHSLSLWYAAVAGVCLFVSGIIAGAADNWFVFNRVGKRLQNAAFLKKWVAPHNLSRAINYIENSIGFWAGNISLGFFLGGMGTIGLLFGLPLDIRHVTFSSGQLGVAMAHMPFQIPWQDFAITAVGVFFIGLINLAVSFSLTLYLTMKSRRIRFSQTRELIRLCFARFRHRPLDFFFPPSEPVVVEIK
jgi:site-specific recombinase